MSSRMFGGVVLSLVDARSPFCLRASVMKHRMAPVSVLWRVPHSLQ